MSFSIIQRTPPTGWEAGAVGISLCEGIRKARHSGNNWGIFMSLKTKYKDEHGFTLIELIVVMAIAMIVMGSIFMTFKSQNDSYVVQTQVAATLQNARAAMDMLTRDIQMTGFYANFDGAFYTMDWDNMDWEGDASDDTMRALILAKNNNAAGSDDGILDGTDLIVIVKASQDSNDGRALVPGETASGTTASASLRDAGNHRYVGSACKS
jgi:prepilin-type N-terminal cleavage/methylation domain-containing protein